MEQLIQFIENHSSDLGGILIDWTNIYFILIVIFLFFSIKGFIHCRSNKAIAKEKDVYSQLIDFNIERAAFCIIIAIVSAYLFIVATGNNEINILLNYFIAPFVSIAFALYLRGIFEERGFFAAKYPAVLLKVGEKTNIDKAQQPVSIVINNSVNDEDADESSVNDGCFDHDDFTKEDYDKRGSVWFINFLYHNQKQFHEKIEKNSFEMAEQSKILESLRQDRLLEKRLELEDLIYSALEQGFVTSSQDKRIREKFRIYQLLGGNGNLAELYKERYLDLQIHSDRI